MRAECDFCQYVADLRECEDGLPRRKAWLCDVCARSPAGTAHFHPEDHWEDAHLLRTIAYATNLLLAECRERSARPMTVECDFCEHAAKIRECEEAQQGRTASLCDVCANTCARTAYFHPEDHWEDVHVLKTIAFATNMVLEQLRQPL